MDDPQLLRYSRQILLPQIGIEGQQRLQAAQVLIVGLGGLGSPVAMYLAAGGVGRLRLLDFDQVDLSNLQRQIIHTTATIGQPKVDSAARTLAALNPDCQVTPINQRLTEEALGQQVAEVDLVLDCSDNFPTRFALNRLGRRHQIPLLSASAIRFEGQLTLFGGKPGDPCYHCLYSEAGEESERCSENGVLAALVGVIGSLQATEALKHLSGIGSSLHGRLLLYDALRADFRTLRLAPDPHCPVCGEEYLPERNPPCTAPSSTPRPAPI